MSEQLLPEDVGRMFADFDRRLRNLETTSRSAVLGPTAVTLLGGGLVIQDGTYRDLTQGVTLTPISISVQTETSVVLIVSITSAGYQLTTGDARTILSYEISGATTRSTATVGGKSVVGFTSGSGSPAGTFYAPCGFMDVATGLTPGLNTFTLKFKQSSAFALPNFDEVTMLVIPLQ